MSGEDAATGRAEGAAGDITAIVVNWHSGDDLAHLLPNLRTKALRPDRIRYLVMDNTNGADTQLDALAAHDVRVLPVDAGERRGSWGHAFALDHAIERVETGLALVTDPDVHVFQAGWDELLAGELRAHDALAAGAPYPWWKLGKYHDFPSPVFMLLDVASARGIGIDWTPFATDLPRRLFNLVARQIVRMGFLATRRRLLASVRLARRARSLEAWFGVCGPDTGYRLARAARDAGKPPVLFTEVTPDDRKLAGQPAARELANDFELFVHRGRPMIAHRYSTRSWLWRTARGADRAHFYDCIERLEAEIAS